MLVLKDKLTLQAWWNHVYKIHLLFIFAGFYLLILASTSSIIMLYQLLKIVLCLQSSGTISFNLSFKLIENAFLLIQLVIFFFNYSCHFIRNSKSNTKCYKLRQINKQIYLCLFLNVFFPTLTVNENFNMAGDIELLKL